MNEVLNEKPLRNGALIAKRILSILSIVFYSGITIFLLYLLISVVSETGDTQSLGYAAFLVMLLTFGSGFYFVSLVLSISSLIVSKIKNIGKNFVSILFIVLPIITWVVLFIVPYLLV
jgi:hypothetical protein